MSQPKFKIGDVVQLKSGGPKMTVGHYGPYVLNAAVMLVSCQWFDKGNVKHADFPPELLRLIEEDEPV